MGFLVCFPLRVGEGCTASGGGGGGGIGGTDPSGKWAGGANEPTLEAESDAAKV